MHYSPNYLDSIWRTNGWEHVYSNYVGGEIHTLKPFHYGYFECRAKFAHQEGSWPAFWLIGGDGVPCPSGGYGSEIDIAELFCEFNYTPVEHRMGHVIHRYYPSNDCNVSNQVEKNKSEYNIAMYDSYNTYKCIWTPNKIQYFINDILKHEVVNQNYEWFPSLPLKLILSQQVLQPYTIIGQMISPVTPQTSYFDYVRVKEFFLAPEITISNSSCLSSTATMDVDPNAYDVTWQLTPSSFFTTSSGSGKVASISKVDGLQGVGKITYTFKMPSNETFTAEKEFWIGDPPTPVIHSTAPYVWTTAYGYPAAKEYTVYTSQDIVVYDENTDIYPGGLLDNYSWSWTLDGSGNYSSYDYGVGGKMYIFNDPNTYRIRCTSTNGCGTTDLSEPVYVVVINEEYLMNLSPNPATNEVTIELENSKKGVSTKELEWSVEVFDQSQSLKSKVNAIKGSNTKIQTGAWKDGVYIVRAKIGKKIISEKLVVKH